MVGPVDDGPLARPVPSRRPLPDREKALLSWLAVMTVATQAGCSEQEAADALDELAGRGQARLYWDDQHAVLNVAGHDLVVAERVWLRLHANDPALN
jgi:hypothetical protein